MKNGIKRGKQCVEEKIHSNPSLTKTSLDRWPLYEHYLNLKNTQFFLKHPVYHWKFIIYPINQDVFLQNPMTF